MKKKAVEVKIKCKCGCGKTLYLVNEHDGLITLGTEKNARKSFAKFDGTVIDKKQLLSLLK